MTSGPWSTGRSPRPKELVAGFWLIEVKSLDEAVEWMKRVPCEPGDEGEIEIRRVYERDDFGDEYSDEARERADRVWERVKDRQ